MFKYAGKLAADGRLTDISIRPPGPGEVPLDACPRGFGPFGYDPSTRTAIPLDADKFTPDERVAAVALAERRVILALALRASASWTRATVAQKATVQAILDDAGVRALAAL